MDRFRLGIAQMTSVDRTEENLKSLKELYRRACQDAAELVVFPENALYFRVASGELLPGLVLDGPEMRELQRLVEEHSAAMMFTTPIETGRLPGASTVFLQPGARPEVVYTKIHLFDVDVEGVPPVRESDFLSGGETPRILEFKSWKFGLSICYDMRFAELYAHYGQKVDVILVPASFLVPTGQAHWHVLLRARAIENQCYVAAPAQSGDHKSNGKVRSTFGHSLLVDPWGKVLLDRVESPAVDVIELDRAEILKVRRQIPMAQHRRLGKV